MQLSKRTIKGHVWQLKRFRRWLGGRDVTANIIRDYLARFKPFSPSTYANVLKFLKVYFRDYLRRGDLVETFKFPTYPIEIKSVPTREQLQRFYAVLQTPRDRALFLMYATTGLRREEVASLKVGDVDLSERMVKPGLKSSATKRRWVSFFNSECADQLRECLEGRKQDERLFPINGDRVGRIFQEASERSGVRITPKILREWFSCEMGRLGVQDRYVDAFNGRVPRSVLARHYSDFSPERLKEIYDRAGLKVLG